MCHPTVAHIQRGEDFQDIIDLLWSNDHIRLMTLTLYGHVPIAHVSKVYDPQLIDIFRACVDHLHWASAVGFVRQFEMLLIRNSVDQKFTCGWAASAAFVHPFTCIGRKAVLKLMKATQHTSSDAPGLDQTFWRSFPLWSFRTVGKLWYSKIPN